jgi:hypothetical protein
MSADGEVANAEEQLQATLNVIPAYTWYADPSGALTFVNERLSDYLGLPKDHPLRFGSNAAHLRLLRGSLKSITAAILVMAFAGCGGSSQPPPVQQPVSGTGQITFSFGPEETVFNHKH